MLKRTLVFGTPCHLSITHGQLIRTSREEGSKQQRVMPTEDIGIVLLEDPAITLSLYALRHLSEAGAAVVVCDNRHHPSALLQPLDGNSVHAEVLRNQVKTTQTKAAKLWRQVVMAKIENQARLLELLDRQSGSTLERASKSVRSADATNREAVASRYYWSRLLYPKRFRRDPDGEAPNDLFNYGYSILRAAAARALVSSGLHCALGIHHRNRYNAFALADDFMEPYRPWVDQAIVVLLDQEPHAFLNREAKARLLHVLMSDVQFENKRRPLMNGLSISSAAMARCLSGKEDKLKYPTFPS
jgi:CRISP-associated protein Cas1